MLKGSVKQNEHIFKGNICIIRLQWKDGTTSAYTVIDKEDAERVLARRWSFEKYKGYVRSHLNGSQIKLHNFIMQEIGLDHIDQDKLNNRKRNLRVATQSENNHNRPLFRNNKSGIKGVCLAKDGRWYASIRIRGKFFQNSFLLKKDAIKFRKEHEKLV